MDSNKQGFEGRGFEDIGATSNEEKNVDKEKMRQASEDKSKKAGSGGSGAY